MAELVQAGLEGMLNELEQMQRVQLLTEDEVREAEAEVRVQAAEATEEEGRHLGLHPVRVRPSAAH